MAERVIATMVVGANGATSLAGTSAPLRSAADRTRFLALRRSPEIAAIVVGGATAKVEPYQKSPHPLIVVERLELERSEIGEILANLRKRIHGTILCEGGARLIHLLLSGDHIDTFFLSRVPINGDDHFLDQSLLRSTMDLVSSERDGSTTFERYERASR